MNRLIIPVTLLAFWLTCGAWWLSSREIEMDTEINKPLSSFHISDEDFNTIIQSELYFNQSSYQLEGKEEGLAVFGDLIQYINSKPKKKLKITGYYTPSEFNASGFEDLGLARAESYGKMLQQIGFAKEQLSLSSKTIDPSAVILRQGVTLSIHSDSTMSAPVVDPLNANFRPLNLSFPTSQYELSLTPKIETYFKQLKTFIAQHPDAKIAVIGHTDDTGELKDNMRLSRYRARKVVDFMLANGFKDQHIVQEFMGPHQPIATNDTESGRKKNRRVEIRIQ